MFFRYFALTLALVVASANGQADSATVTVNAHVITLINIGDTSTALRAEALFSGVTGDLVVRLPGGVTFQKDSNYINSVSPMASTALLSDCAQACIKNRSENGLLRGNPVYSLILAMAEDIQSAKSTVSVIFAFN